MAGGGGGMAEGLGQKVYLRREQFLTFFFPAQRDKEGQISPSELPVKAQNLKHDKVTSPALLKHISTGTLFFFFYKNNTLLGSKKVQKKYSFVYEQYFICKKKTQRHPSQCISTVSKCCRGAPHAFWGEWGPHRNALQ